MRPPKYLQNVLVGASALVFAGTYAGARLMPERQQTGPVLTAAVDFVTPKPDSAVIPSADNAVVAAARTAVGALGGSVRSMSRPEALESAFKSYFAYKAANPNTVRKPFLYYVDYGLPSTEPRGYVFDMEQNRVVDGPFTVAHGRGSSSARTGVPTRFSNVEGSAATSLGLYVARSLYDFRGSYGGGRRYSSIGLRLQGVSEGFNDAAMRRGVVAHGAPYVTSEGAGRSEGCPAMESDRAERLLPKIADGGMVFLYAPNEQWLDRDPWIAAASE